MFWKRAKLGQRGQSAVETAIVMPLNVFIILAIIQNGLIAQARLMAKYAAYRAVRVGVMNNADVSKMTNAALATLAPVSPFPTSGFTGQEVFRNMTQGVTAAEQLGLSKLYNVVGGPVGLPVVKVVICGPLANDLTGLDQNTLTGNGSSDEIDFDDPRASTEWSQTISGDTSAAMGAGNFTQFMATKLRIQVQFNYRMIIPFANWIISLSRLGLDLPDVMRMQASSSNTGTRLIEAKDAIGADQWIKLAAAHALHIYYAPINVSYAMRMQSNIFVAEAPIPSGGTKTGTGDNCIHYVPGGTDDGAD